MKQSLFFGKKAFSPVIATGLLVAVSLVVAVSCTFYYTTVVGTHTNFEQVEVRSVKVYPVDDLKQLTNNVMKGTGWNISITLTNVGTKQVTITSMLLNGRSLDTYDRVAVFNGTEYVQSGDISVIILRGNSYQLFITIKNGEDKNVGIVFSPGLNIEVALQNTSGVYYMQFATLN